MQPLNGTSISRGMRLFLKTSLSLLSHSTLCSYHYSHLRAKIVTMQHNQVGPEAAKSRIDE